MERLDMKPLPVGEPVAEGIRLYHRRLGALGILESAAVVEEHRDAAPRHGERRVLRHGLLQQRDGTILVAPAR